MRTRCNQRPNRSEGPCASAAPDQVYGNTRSLEPARKLRPFTPTTGVNGAQNALARFTAIGMTITWNLILFAVSTVQPCAAIIQSPQVVQPALAQPSPAPATPASQSAPTPQPSPFPTPQASPTAVTPQADTDSSSRVPMPFDEIVVTAVGDVMLGTTFPDESALPPNDGAGLLAEVTPFLKRGDVVYGNLEGPIVDGGVSAKCRGKKEGTCFAFRVPTRYGKYLKDAGFTAMGLANNHAMDFGLEGRASSRQVLDAMQIVHTGEVGDIARLIVKGR